MSVDVAGKHGLRISAHVAYSLLQNCSKTRDLKALRRIQSEIASTGLRKNVFLGNQLICLFSLCGSFSDAIQAFRKLPTPDEHSWSAILNACLRHGNPSLAIKFYGEFRNSRRKTEPNDYIYVAVLKACGSLTALIHGRQIHAQIAESGYESNLYVGNALIDMYAKCRSLKDSQKVFDGLVGKDVVSWNVLIAAYAQNGFVPEALRLFQDMQHEKVKPDKVTFLNILKACKDSAAEDEGKIIHSNICKFGLDSHISVRNALISMYSECGSLTEARKVFNQTPDRDLVTWSAMISGYSKQGFGEEALYLFHEMQDQGIRPDAMTYVSILKACGSVAAVDQGKQIHKQVVADRLLADAYVGSSLVDMYAKCGDLEQAYLVFQNLPTKTLVSWNLLIAAYAKKGLAKQALQLYQAMQLSQVRPDSSTYIYVLKASGSLGGGVEGKLLHEEIVQSGVEMDTVIGNVLIDMYCKCGLLKEAAEVFDSLRTRDIYSWNRMAAGYSTQRHGPYTLHYFNLMQLEGIRPDTASYNNILRYCGSIEGLYGQDDPYSNR